MQRPMFQYKCYSLQLPLKLSPQEMEDLISALTSPSSSPSPSPSPHSEPSEAAGSLLLKLMIDMYLADKASSGPLALSLLQSLLDLPQIQGRIRAFDLLLNLGVHAHLLQPEEWAPEGETQPLTPNGALNPSLASEFEQWLRALLGEVLLYLIQVEEGEEQVWASALSCLLFLCCHRGHILKEGIRPLDIRVLAKLLAVGQDNGWAQPLITTLTRMMVSLLYSPTSPPPTSSPSAPHTSPPLGPTGGAPQRPPLDRRKLKAVGGIHFICSLVTCQCLFCFWGVFLAQIYRF